MKNSPRLAPLFVALSVTLSAVPQAAVAQVAAARAAAAPAAISGAAAASAVGVRAVSGLTALSPSASPSAATPLTSVFSAPVHVPALSPAPVLAARSAASAPSADSAEATRPADEAPMVPNTAADKTAAPVVRNLAETASGRIDPALLFDASASHGKTASVENGGGAPTFASTKLDRHEKMVLVTLFYAGTPAALDAAVQELGRATGFRLDYGFEPSIDDHLAIIRGAVPGTAVAALSRQPGVFDVANSGGAPVTDLVPEPYRPPVRESLFRAGFRALAKKNTGLGLLVGFPLQLGVYAALFGPLFAVSAAGVLAPVVGIGAVALLTAGFLGPIIPARWTFGASYAAVTAAGIGLSVLGHPLGAWIAANGLAGFFASRKMLESSGAAPNSHIVDKLTNSTELAAHANAIGWALMAVPLTFLGPTALFAALALTSLFLISSLISYTKSPKPAPMNVSAAPRPKPLGYVSTLSGTALLGLLAFGPFVVFELLGALGVFAPLAVFASGAQVAAWTLGGTLASLLLGGALAAATAYRTLTTAERRYLQGERPSPWAKPYFDERETIVTFADIAAALRRFGLKAKNFFDLNRTTTIDRFHYKLGLGLTALVPLVAALILLPLPGAPFIFAPTFAGELFVGMSVVAGIIAGAIAMITGVSLDAPKK